MKKWLTVITAVVMAVSVGNLSAQRVPDEDDVLGKVMSSDSPYYYPPLMIRYMAGDLTLTADDYYYLYYGFAYDSAYDAHAELPGENRILEMFAGGTTPGREQAEAMLEAAKENMMADPFNPGNINMMTFAYNLLNDTINEIISADRFNKVVAAIKSSGTGTKESSPWHVLRFTHANDVVASMGYAIESRQVRTRTVEYIRLVKNPDMKGLFFDFGRVYWNPYEGEAVRRKSKWMLNDIPL